MLATVVSPVIAVAFASCRSASPSPKEETTPPAAITDRLLADERQRIEVFRRACPSIVHVESLMVRRDPAHLNVLEIPSGLGTGFVWDRSGHLVTNLHVIRGSDEVRVSFKDGTSRIARVMGDDPTCDIALLMVDAPAEALVPIEVDRAVAPEVGQSVLAIGNPFGLDHTLTVGVISALGRDLRTQSGGVIHGVIQVDAAINPGNSGGPLLDSAGRLLGVNTALTSPSGAFAGVGFAVPLGAVDAAVSHILGLVPARQPGLGARFAEDSWARELGLPGPLVLEVLPGSSAEQAGLRPTRTSSSGDLELGDVIVAVGGVAVGSRSDVFAALAALGEGERVDVTVLREGESVVLSIAVKLEEHP